MKIEYKSKAIQKICEESKQARKKYGDQMAQKLRQRLNEIQAADSVEMLIQYHIGKCHALKGDREGQYAMHLEQPYRLIFQKVAGSTSIKIVKIMEIVDYH